MQIAIGKKYVSTQNIRKEFKQLRVDERVYKR
jgi:hypothetical protein